MSTPVAVPLRRMFAVALAAALAMPSATLCAAPLTPKAAFDLALRQTPELVRSRARVAGAKGAVKEAKGHLLPSLDLNVSASTSNDPLNVFGMKLQQRQATFNDFGAGQFLAGVDNPDIVNEEVHDLNYPGWYQNFQTELQLQVPIYNGGQVWGGVHRAEAMLAAARHGERLAQQKILFEVIRLFEGIRTAEGYRKAAAQGVGAAGSYLKLTEKLYAHGVVAETDVLQARVHLGDARLTEAESRKQQAVAMEGLRVLTGTGDDQPLVLAPGHVTVRLAEGDPHQLAKQAVEGNPGVRALGEKVQAAQAGVTQARAAYKPHVNLVLSQAWNDQQVDLANASGTAALVLRWNLLDFGSRGGAVDQANAKVIESQGSLRKAQDDLQVKVRTAWEDVQLATTRISLEQTALSDASESARLAQLRYENGVITFTQLLDAQAELNKARADLVSARYQKVMAGAGLLLALGRLETSALTLTGAGAAR